MYVAGLIVEKLDEDGHLQSVCLEPIAGHRYRVAFAEDMKAPNSGPFFLPDEDDTKKFEHRSEKSKNWKLPDTQFANTDSICQLRHTCVGIPTERQTLTYYALCLPKFAVPIPNSIRVSDIRSDRTFSKSVVRNDHLKCFVIYLPCRSRYGEFDFLLEARFRIETPDAFRRARYRDEHTAKDIYGFQLIKRAADQLSSRTAEVAASAVGSNGNLGAHVQETAAPVTLDAANDEHGNGDMGGSEFRASWVERIISELATLRRLMRGPGSYEKLEQTYSHFHVFKIAKAHPDLREKIEAVTERRQVVGLAQELAAAKFRKSVATLEKDWKRHKPKKQKQVSSRS